MTAFSQEGSYPTPMTRDTFIAGSPTLTLGSRWPSPRRRGSLKEAPRPSCAEEAPKNANTRSGETSRAELENGGSESDAPGAHHNAEPPTVPGRISIETELLPICASTTFPAPSQIIVAAPGAHHSAEPCQHVDQVPPIPYPVAALGPILTAQSGLPPAAQPGHHLLAPGAHHAAAPCQHVDQVPQPGPHSTAPPRLHRRCSRGASRCSTLPTR